MLVPSLLLSFNLKGTTTAAQVDSLTIGWHTDKQISVNIQNHRRIAVSFHTSSLSKTTNQTKASLLRLVSSAKILMNWILWNYHTRFNPVGFKPNHRVNWSRAQRNHDVPWYGSHGGDDRGLRPCAEVPSLLRRHHSGEFFLANRTGSTRKARLCGRVGRVVVILIVRVFFKSALFGAHVYWLCFYGAVPRKMWINNVCLGIRLSHWLVSFVDLISVDLSKMASWYWISLLVWVIS